MVKRSSRILLSLATLVFGGREVTIVTGATPASVPPPAGADILSFRSIL